MEKMDNGSVLQKEELLYAIIERKKYFENDMIQ